MHNFSSFIQISIFCDNQVKLINHPGLKRLSQKVPDNNNNDAPILESKHESAGAAAAAESHHHALLHPLDEHALLLSSTDSMGRNDGNAVLPLQHPRMDDDAPREDDDTIEHPLHHFGGGGGDGGD